MDKIQSLFDQWFNQPLSDTTPPISVLKGLSDEELENLDLLVEDSMRSWKVGD